MQGMVFDVWSAIHILMFFILGLITFAYSKKAYIGFSIGMTIGVIWEIIERFIIVELIGVYIFSESYLNSLTDLFIYDVIGLILAYIYVKKTYKRKC